jgi:NAD(P)-dependent dehydrogenase (short-subunit alcohol dehydrogenase family)
MDQQPRPILVTGASTGIGNHLTRRLAELGHTVFATARKPADLESLAAIPGVEPVAMDVRRLDDVRRAVAQVEARGAGLYGLVNNAGLGGIGPLATWSEEELLEIFDVNALAPIRLTQAFLPLLLRAGGRVVNIGSQGGSISMRYFGPYTMTKHALEAFTVALAQELGPYGVEVSIVQPGGVRSAIGENSLSGTMARFRRATSPFAEEAQAVLASFEQEPPADAAGEAVDEREDETHRQPSSPGIVAVAVLDALFAENPRPRYLVGTRWEGSRVLDALMERLLDANDCPTLGHPLDELIAMLQARAAKRDPRS